MNAELGVFLLLLALIASIYAAVASIVGRDKPHIVKSARNALYLTWPLVTMATLLLISLLYTMDFNTSFVWSVIDTQMPAYLRITALWGGQAGSLVFWSWLLISFVCGAVLASWDDERHLMPISINVFAVTVAFFLLLVTFWENPFAQFYQPAGGGNPYAVLFGTSTFLATISDGIAAVGARLPGMFGVIADGIVPLAAPAGSFAVHPSNGQGLNPLLRHPGMIIHPPMLYLGFVGFVVPFGFGIAALSEGDTRDTWMQASRRWTLIAWLFLSLGLILGGWWAYDVLGWGGYWAWDPVENASFMPWLTGTAFLHSVMIQEKRGMLRRWNVILIILTYLLVILGTFATRSGIVSSVHSFAQSAIGPLFLIFLGVALVTSVALVIRRWDDLAADNELDSLLSRETIFLVNNLVFLSITITVGVGTYWPVFTEILAEYTSVEKSSLGPSFYESATMPMFLALIVLMGIAPLIAWKRASIKRLGKAILWPVIITIAGVAILFAVGIRLPLALLGYGLVLLSGTITIFEYIRGAQARMRAHKENAVTAMWRLFGRNRRRYGGYMIHLGVVIMAIGIISNNTYQLETQQAVSAGQTITLGEYVLEYETLERYIATDGRAVTQAVTNVYRNGNQIAEIKPRVDNYASGQPMSIPGKIMTPTGDDFYVLLVAWEQLGMDEATFKVYVNPLVNWIWGGGFVFIVGTMIAAWPEFKTARQSVRRRNVTAVPAAGD